MVCVFKMFPILVFCKVENSPQDKNKTQRRKAPGLVFLCRGENRFCPFCHLIRKNYFAPRYVHYSNSTVAGGLEVISYSTRLTPLTSLTIRTLTRFSSS